MEETAGKHIQLVDDIRRDAAAETEKLAAEARQQAGERARQYERQIEEIRAEGAAAAAAQAGAIGKSLQAALAVEVKRITLKARDQVFRRILERVEEKLAAWPRSGKYRSVLIGLIAEAAVGLGADAAEVNASPAELALIDDELLREAEAKVKELFLRTVKLKKSQAAPLLLQGVVLTSGDGTLAFNNQIRTRLLRNQGPIRKLIYDRLSLM